MFIENYQIIMTLYIFCDIIFTNESYVIKGGEKWNNSI